MQALGIAVLSTVLSGQVASYFSQNKGADPNMAFIQGFNSAFFVVFAVAALGVIVGFFMPGKPGIWPLKRSVGGWGERKPAEPKPLRAGRGAASLEEI